MLWVARDKDKSLHLFLDKPERMDVNWSTRELCSLSDEVYWSEDSVSDLIDGFSHLTWDDDPIEVKIVSSRKSKGISNCKICETCKFKNENPRCSTGVPCGEWSLDERLKRKNK